MPDSIYNWIVDYFVRHEHCTTFEGITSSISKVNSSVIQGSGIGPASYSVAASDLHPVVNGNKIIKFADDFDLLVPASNVDSRVLELQHVQSWATANNLQLNCKKSHELVFTRPRSRLKLIVSEIPDVPRATSIKLLGVTLTSNFSMEDHVADIISSSARTLYALRILRAHGMKQSDLYNVFRATTLSKLQYASPSWWGFTNQSQRDHLEGFLRKAVKAGFNPEGSPLFSTNCEVADDAFLRRVISNEHHPLRHLLPPKLSRAYNMRARDHEYQLPAKHNSVHECNFFIRIFYHQLNN